MAGFRGRQLGKSKILQVLCCWGSNKYTYCTCWGNLRRGALGTEWLPECDCSCLTNCCLFAACLTQCFLSTDKSTASAIDPPCSASTAAHHFASPLASYQCLQVTLRSPSSDMSSQGHIK
jgi:hypothetical protein